MPFPAGSEADRRLPRFYKELMLRSKRFPRNNESRRRTRRVVTNYVLELQKTPEERAQLDNEAQYRRRVISEHKARELAMKQCGLSEEELHSCTFSSIIPKTRSQSVMIYSAKDWVKSYPRLELPLGLAFCGPEGIGKSRTLRAACRYLVIKSAQPVKARYIFAPVLNEELRKDITRDPDEMSIREAILNHTDVLFLDDLFKINLEELGNWLMDFYMSLFDQIERLHKPLLWFTTNTSPDDIRAYFKDNGHGWFIDRILSQVISYEVDGPNGRTVRVVGNSGE